MSRLKIAALAVCLLVPALVHAKDVAELIPGDTLGYVVIHRLADTDAKIEGMGERMKLPIPSLVAMAKTQAGIAEGVNESGSIAVAFLPTPEGPSAVLYVPVDDYAAFIKQLDPDGTEDGITTARLMGRAVIVGEKAGHAVVAWPNNRALLKTVLSDQGATDGAKTVEGDHDVAALLSSSGVKMLADLGLKGLGEAKDALRQQLGEDNPALAGIEVYVQMLKAFTSEVSEYAVGLKLDEEGTLRVNEWFWVRPTGQIAPILRDLKPYDGDLLAGLPDIPFVVAGGGVIPPGAVEPMMDFSGNMMKSMRQLYGLTPEQVDTMMELSMKYFADFRGMSFLLGAGKDDGPLYSEMLGSLQVPDAKAYIADYKKFWKELNEVIGEAEGSFLKDVKVEDVVLDGVSALKVSMPIPGMEGLDVPGGDLDALMEKLYGPEGITVYMTAAGKDTVLLAYTEPALLHKALQAKTDVTKHISKNQNVDKTSKLLPAGGQMTGFWSPSGTAAFVGRMMRLIAGPDAGIQIPAFPETSPVGWTLQATPSVVRVHSVIPADTFEAVGSYVAKMRQLEGAPTD